MLNRLSAGFPAITPAVGTMMAEAASVCLEQAGHPGAASIRLDLPEGRISALIVEAIPLDDRIRRSHANETDATEAGACGIAILAMLEEFGFLVVERSYQGTGFDYWLGTSEDTPPFASDSAALEVSGIMAGGPSEIRRRAGEKRTQITRYEPDPPYRAFIAVVEFGMPCTLIERL